MSRPRRRIPRWVNQMMYRHRVLEREGEYVGDGQEEELSEEEQQRLERSKAHHPSQGRTMEP
jgi:hypothetical protein